MMNEAQFIEDEKLSGELFSDLVTLSENKKFEISKEPIANRHVDNVIDTLLTYKLENNLIRQYKAKSEIFIYEADFQSSNFTFSRGIKVALTKNELETILKTKVLSDTIQIGNLEQTSVFTLLINKNKVKRIFYEGYVD